MKVVTTHGPFVLVAGAFLLGVCGCMSDPTAELRYGRVISNRTIADDMEIVVKPFRDLRPNPRIGMHINLFDNVRYSINSVNDVGTYVSEAMVKEFTARGYKARMAAPGEEVDESGKLIVTGDVLKMETVQPGGLTLEGNTRLAVRVVKDGTTVFEKRFAGSVQDAVEEWAANADMFASVCEESLRNLMMNLLPGLDHQIQLALGRAVGVLEE